MSAKQIKVPKTKQFPAAARKADYRSPLAKARDDYINSEEGERACDPNTLGGPGYDRRHYLTNRIEAAFLAGAKWAAFTHPSKKSK